MRDKLINKMAEAWYLKCVESASDTLTWEEFKLKKPKLAEDILQKQEAALDALLGELEEPKIVQEIGTGFIEGKIVITDARKLYQQLLDMRK
jgi:hypothetical protein